MHTAWNEYLDYRFEFVVPERWRPHVRSLRLRNDVEAWIDENMDRENLKYVFDRGVLKYIAFRTQDDLLLFTMAWC